MRRGVFVPPFGELADPRAVADLGAAAEEAGWDGLFVWDHVLRADQSVPVADPWIVLAAAATATSRIRLGALVTPLARRRPWVVARQTVTLDHLSGGRLVVGVGLGNDNGRELSAFGEPVDPRERARRLDASLDVLAGLWSGGPLTHHGEGLTVDGVRFAPPPVQRPRIPVWVGFGWPNRAPWRRAARWDGAFPDGSVPPDGVAELLAYVTSERGGALPDPYDVVLQGRRGAFADGTPADLAALEAAGATWWMEAFAPGDPLAEVCAAVAAGPA